MERQCPRERDVHNPLICNEGRVEPRPEIIGQRKIGKEIVERRDPAASYRGQFGDVPVFIPARGYEGLTPMHKHFQPR